MTTYLDNAATSFPKPEAVYRAMDRCAREQLANPGRSGHRRAVAAERLIDDCRGRLNRLFNGRAAERFVLTLNGTDALNMAIKGALSPGDHVVTSLLEHNSVSRPLRAMELQGIITVTKVRHDASGRIDPASVRPALTPRTKLVALTHASNVLGTIQPIAEIGRIVREHGALLLVDAAQTAGVLPIDIQADHIDLLAAPAHKGLLGPPGTGFLFVGPRTDLRPWREGGTGGDSLRETQPAELPYRLEGGTPNLIGAAGLSAGIDYLRERGLDDVRAHEAALISRLRLRLGDFGCEVYGPEQPDRRVGVVAFRSDKLPAAELAAALDSAFDIAVRPGLHCAPYVHQSLGTLPDGLVRASVGPFNSEADVDLLARAVAEILSAA